MDVSNYSFVNPGWRKRCININSINRRVDETEAPGERITPQVTHRPSPKRSIMANLALPRGYGDTEFSVDCLQFADRPAVHQLKEFYVRRMVAMVESLDDADARSFSSGDHRLRLNSIYRKGFFDKHMLSRLRGLDCPFGVERDWQWIVDQIDVGRRDNVVVAFDRQWNFVRGGEISSAIKAPRAYTDDLDTGQFRGGIDHGCRGNLSRPKDADPHRLHCGARRIAAPPPGASHRIMVSPDVTVWVSYSIS